MKSEYEIWKVFSDLCEDHLNYAFIVEERELHVHESQLLSDSGRAIEILRDLLNEQFGGTSERDLSRDEIIELSTQNK